MTHPPSSPGTAPRYGKREVMPGITVNGCWKASDVPHGVGHNAVCVCCCAWCEDERAALGPPQGELFPEPAP